MWDYRAQLIRVVDADTVVLLIDQGMSNRREEALRLLNVSAPEHNKPGGPQATAFTQQWMNALSPAWRWPMRVLTQPNTKREPEEDRTYVRYLATVSDMALERCLNDDLRAYLAEHPEWGHGM
jgi:hypothetical protein